jgi:two-component system nitrogen regulation response regulator GlnG
VTGRITYSRELLPDNLASHSSIDHETMWRYMRQLVDRLFGALEGESAVDDGLDILVDVLGADRGLILLTRADGSSLAVNARGQRKPLTPEEREEISKTIVHEALQSNRCVTWDPSSTMIPGASVVVLNILAALAAPLTGGPGGKPRGVLYVDFRDRRKFVEDRHVEFFMSAATLLGAVLEQHARAMTTRDQLRGAKTFFVESRRSLPLDELLGQPSMKTVASEVEASLRGDAPILVLGESGTGKTLLAQAIAEASGRRPIVRALLGASDDLNTITSELFGHEKGAYSGAASKRVGLVEFAAGGMLILDELLNLPPHAQRLLLDFTQFGTYRPLGYERAEPKTAEVRIIAATNGDLHAAVRDGRFRQDLYHRLAGTVLELPPLRARREEVPGLAESALRRADPSRAWKLSVPMRRLLLSPAIEWPGNVRQLETVMRRARERAIAQNPEADVVCPEHVSPRDLDVAAIDAAAAVPSEPSESSEAEWRRLQSERDRIDEREADVIRATLQRCGGVVAQTARELGIARTTLLGRMDSLGIRAAKRY